MHYFLASRAEHLAGTPGGDVTAAAIDHDNAAALFPRLAQHPVPAVRTDPLTTTRAAVKSHVFRALFKLVDPARP